MGTTEKVSIIIPTFNRKNELRNCLESIYRQDYPNFEVLIIDNASTDGTKEMVLNEYPKIRLFCNKRNLYACKSRNFGVAVCSGSYVWFLDSDCIIVNNDCLATMVKLIKSDDTFGGIGGTVYVFDDQSTRIVIPKNNHFEMFDDWDREDFQLVECDFLPSSNLLMKRDILLKIGGFTEIYKYLMEDNDLGLKVINLGLKNVVDRRTVALHPFKTSTIDFMKSYNFYRNIFLYFILNFHHTKWLETLVDRFQGSNGSFERHADKISTIKIKGSTQCLNKFSGMLFGLAYVILLSIPIIKILFGSKDYITKYYSVEGTTKTGK
jgi:GT2 family glycosyltransferase